MHSFVFNYAGLLVLAAFTGIGMSINVPAANKGIFTWFTQKERSTATGTWSTAFPAGGIIAALFLPLLGKLIGWRFTVLFQGIIIFLCGLFVLKFFKVNNKDIQKNHKSVEKKISFWNESKKMLKNKNYLYICFFGFFLGSISGITASHFILYLYLDHGLTETISGMGFAALQIGSVFGRPMWGLLCDRFLHGNKSRGFLYLGLLVFIIFFIFGHFLKNSDVSLFLLFLFAFLTGCTSRGWHGLFYSSIAEVGGEKNAGISIGLSLLFLRFGIMLGPPLFGYLADLRNSYDYSWSITGSIILIVSVGQYLLYDKKVEFSPADIG